MKLYKNIVKVGSTNLHVVTVNQEDTEDNTIIESFAPQKVHHIHIIDRSGSMSGEICNLIEQVKDTLKLMSNGDIVSVIWFSSPGQYRTLVKGAKNTPELLKLLDSLKSTIGCTCFSDPLKEVREIVNELYSLNSNISVTLFTDGEACGVPWGYAEEENRCYSIVKELSDKIIAFNTVGYSNYYNQDFLKKLASISEFGIFTHSSKIDEYSSIFQNNFDRIVGGKIENVNIKIPQFSKCIYLTRKFIKMSTDELNLNRLDKNKNQFFLIGLRDFNFEYNGESYSSTEITEAAQAPTIRNFLYAYAYSMYYANERMESLNALAELRDKALIDSHINSFTYDECSEHQKKLELATLDSSARLLDGRAKEGYLPKEDAFCLINLIDRLGEEEAYYLPYHKEASDYNRIGKKVEEDVDYFNWSDEVVMAPFTDLVFNKDKANLSIRMKINGTVKIPAKEAKAAGLPSEIDSHIYRVHTFIKNGYLNIKKCIAAIPTDMISDMASDVPKGLFEVLKGDKNLLKELKTKHGKEYSIVKINFRKIPIINRMMNDKSSADLIFDTISYQTGLECYQKCLNYHLNLFEESATAAQKKVGLFEGKTAEQISVLERYGLDKNGSYSGVGRSVPKNEDCDFYESRSFSFVFKGLSSLPSVDDAIAYNDRKTTKSSIGVVMMADTYKELQELAKTYGVDLSKAVNKTRDFLNSKLRDVKNELFKIRAHMCAIKIAKIMLGDTFAGFTVDAKNNYVFEKDGRTLIMKMERTKEYFTAD